MSQSYQNHWPKTMAYTIPRGSYLFSLATATSSCPETAPIPVSFKLPTSTLTALKTPAAGIQFATHSSVGDRGIQSKSSSKSYFAWLMTGMKQEIRKSPASMMGYWIPNSSVKGVFNVEVAMLQEVGSIFALTVAATQFFRSRPQGRLEIWCPSCLTFDIDEFICSQRVDGSEVLITMWSTMLCIQIRKESMRWIHIEIIKLTSSHAPSTQKHIAVSRQKDMTWHDITSKNRLHVSFLQIPACLKIRHETPLHTSQKVSSKLHTFCKFSFYFFPAHFADNKLGVHTGKDTNLKAVK